MLCPALVRTTHPGISQSHVLLIQPSSNLLSLSTAIAKFMFCMFPLQVSVIGYDSASAPPSGRDGGGGRSGRSSAGYSGNYGGVINDDFGATDYGGGINYNQIAGAAAWLAWAGMPAVLASMAWLARPETLHCLPSGLLSLQACIASTRAYSDMTCQVVA